MHTANIWRIGVDRACTLMASGSDDKTLRIWRLPEGRLIRTIRPPIGHGYEGRVFAVSMAPDGSWVAAGGWTTSQRHFLYVFEPNSGRLLARLGPLENPLSHTTVSHDGRYLAATLGSGLGLRVWRQNGSDGTNWQLIAEDRNYSGKNARGASFDRHGNLFTVSYDGKIRRYPANKYANKPLMATTVGGKEPFSVSAHPTDNRIAIGFRDTRVIEVYDSNALTRRYAADTSDVNNGDLSTVAWSHDGTRLFAAGQYQRGGYSPVRIWERGGQGAYREGDGPLDTVQSMLPCGDGVAIGTADPAIGLFAGDGTRLMWRGNVQPDMRETQTGRFAVSPDGRQVSFGLGWRRDYVMFDLNTEKLTDAQQVPSGLYLPDRTGVPVADWENSFTPSIGGNRLKLVEYERARSASVSNSKNRVAIGTEYNVRFYDQSGGQLWEKQVPGVAWGVNVPRASDLVVAAYGDGTIRWHRQRDGQELLALFVHAKDRRWVAWTPKGYFTASLNGEELIGWHVNRSWTETGDYFPTTHFRDQFYRPDIVQLVLATLDEEAAINQANANANRKRQDESIAKRQPPVVTILSPTPGSEFNSQFVTISYTVRSPSGLAIRRVRALVDGVAAEGGESKGLVPIRAGEVPGELKVKVPPRNVILAVIAETDTNESTPVEVELKWAGPKPTLADLEKPELYALLIGVSNYKQSKWSLKFAAKDARDFAAVLQKLKGGLYRDVHIELLLDEQATERNIRTKVSAIKRTMTAKDLALVFFSGHGVTMPDQSSFLLPVDFDAQDIESTGYNKRLLLDELRRFPGKALVFMDACQSAGGLDGFKTAGRFDAIGLVNEFKSAGHGLITFASSLSGQLSAELDKLQNGVFTKGLLEGVAGAADVNGDRVIDTVELDLYLTRRVKQLSGGYQDAIMNKPSAMPHFPIASIAR